MPAHAVRAVAGMRRDPHDLREQALYEGTCADVQGVPTCDGCDRAIEDNGSHLCPRCAE